MNCERRLQIFVAAHCVGLERALHLAEEVRALRPLWEVKVVDLDAKKAQAPDFVVATPMYVAEDRALFWGNPSLERLVAQLDLMEQGS